MGTARNRQAASLAVCGKPAGGHAAFADGRAAGRVDARTMAHARSAPRHRPAARRGSKRRQPRSLRLPLIIGVPVVLVAIFLAALFLLRPSPTEITKVQFGPEIRSELAGIPQHGDTLGNAAAPVTITEYADLLCPACRAFETSELPDVLPLVREGKVKVKFRLWSIIGPRSGDAARAAYAAKQQDQLWTYATLFYANQGPESDVDTWVTRSFMRGVADAAGLDTGRFASDLTHAFDSPNGVNAWLQQASTEATRLGANGTPTLVVDGPGGHADVSTPTAAAVRQAVESVSAQA
jgi:protein-disulfide isomerase